MYKLFKNRMFRKPELPAAGKARTRLLKTSKDQRQGTNTPNWRFPAGHQAHLTHSELALSPMTEERAGATSDVVSPVQNAWRQLYQLSR